MPSAARLKRKRKSENEVQAQQCKKLFQFFTRPESPCNTRLDESIDTPSLEGLERDESRTLPQRAASSDTSGSSMPCTSTRSSASYSTDAFTEFSTPCASQDPSDVSAFSDSSETVTSINLPLSTALSESCSSPAPVSRMASSAPLLTVNSTIRAFKDQTQQRSRNNSGHGTSFNPSWKENRPWLENRKEMSSDGFSFDSMYCLLCQKWDTKGRNNSTVWNRVGCVSTRLDVIAKHEQSDMHRDAVFKEMALDKGVDVAFETMNKKEYEALKDAQKVLYFLIKHHLPYNTLYEPLMELCIELGASNLQNLPKAKNATYTSKATANEFLDCQAEVVETSICNALQQSQSYGIMLDEYTDISSRKHLAIVGRYIDSGASKLAFLQDIQLPNGEAQTIYTAMKNHLTEAGIPIQKMTSFASDGPSVMLGKKNGVVAMLKRDNPDVINVHCMNHRLQLAVSKAFHSVPMIDNTDELLTSLFKYYHYSTVRSESLNAIQTLLRDTGELETQNNITVKKAVHTRWLSHEAAVQTIRKLYPAIIADLENAVASGRDKTVKENRGVQAGSLLKMMRTYQKLYFIHLLCDVCTSLASLTKTFEKEDVDLSVIEPRVMTTLVTLKRMKEKDGAFTSRVASVAKSLNIEANDNVLQSIYNARDEFLDNLAHNMEDRLENTEVINYLSMLDLSQVQPDMTSFHGDAAISFLSAHFNLDEDKTLHEWNELKEFFVDKLSSCTPKYLLETLTKSKPVIGEMFPNILKLLAVHESLILSTSAVERVFSRVKLTVTSHRNRLAVKTVSKLMTVSLNTNTVKDVDLDRVVKLYLEKKKRRLFSGFSNS